MEREIKAYTLLVAGLLLSVVPALSQGKISGTFYGDYFYNFNRDAALGAQSNVATKGETAFQGFQFRRIYFTYDHHISDQFVSRFRLEADQGDLFNSGKIGVAVKDAYLRWKNIFNGSDATFGIQPPPAYEVLEASWGFRSLEKTIMDLRGIVSSRDFGISLKGNLVESGVFGYWLMVANGSGNKPETDKYKRYYAHLQVKPIINLLVTLYADYADHADVADPHHLGTKVSNGQFTTAFFAGYKMADGYSMGVEGFVQSTSNGFNNGSSLTTKSGLGLSLFGSVSLQSNVALVGRYDYFDPNTDDKATGDARNYIIAGLSWKPDKNVSIVPNVLYETYEALSNGESIDASLTARVTVSFNFQ